MVFSVIQKSELEGARRIDAEYYSTDVPTAQTLLSRGFKQLGDFISDGYRAVYWSTEIIPRNLMSSDNVFFMQAADIDSELPFVLPEKMNGVWKEDWDKYPKGRVKRGEILVEVKGKAEKVAIIPDDFPENTLVTGTVYKFSVKNILPEYVLAYFLSKYGQTLRDRLKTNILVSFINKNDLYQLPIFVPERKEQEVIAAKVIELKVLYDDSRLLNTEAVKILLEELGIKKSDFGDELSYVVDFAEVDDRSDAEYFQPKYQKLVEKIKATGSKKLGEITSIKKGFESGSEAYQDEGKLFIRVSSLSKFGIRTLDQKYLSDELYEKLKKDYEPQVGEILLTKDATPGIAYVLSEPVEGIISGGILRLKLKQEVDPEYLALVINSLVGQMQAERDAGGSVIKHWKPDQIKDLEIPILPQATQEKIGDLVRQSHAARQKSKQLLEQAKREVEALIED